MDHTAPSDQKEADLPVVDFINTKKNFGSKIRKRHKRSKDKDSRRIQASLKSDNNDISVDINTSIQEPSGLF
jgi:hypothetical protein